MDRHSGPPLGVWKRVGDRDFAFAFLVNVFNASGDFTSNLRVHATVTLSDDGLSATGKTRLEVLDPTGQVISSSTSTIVADRLVAEP